MSKILILFLFSCGSADTNLGDCESNPASICQKQTPDEEVAIALNNGELETAQAKLEALIIAFPLSYARYAKLATVYALEAGFDILKIALSGGDVVNDISDFLPNPLKMNKNQYRKYIEKMEKAKEVLLKIPPSHRSKGAYFYSASAILQLSVYSAALSVMLLNQFKPSGNATLDARRLAQLSVDEALEVVSSLAEAALITAQDNPELSAKLNSVLSEIGTAEGSNQKDKIANYLEANR